MRATDAGWTSWGERAGELARTPVVVLFGGTSSERDVSLASGRAMAAALAAEPPPAAVHAVEVDARGRWVVDGAALAAPAAVAALPGDALYVLGLHGGEGEDGRVQAFLELSGRRYTGAGPAASALCLDKRRAREAAASAGLALAPGRAWRREELAADPGAAAAACARLGPPPWFVKPACGGSSVGVSRVAEPAALAGALEALAAAGEDVLVEVGQAGLEVTCGVLGNRGEEPVLLPPCEVLPKDGRFFDYDEKYAEDGARELCPPEHLAPPAAERLQDRALAAYRALGIEGYARLDFVVPPEGLTGEAKPVFLEANTLPGFTPRSILPRMAAATGVDFRSLCLELCARALARCARIPS